MVLRVSDILQTGVMAGYETVQERRRKEEEHQSELATAAVARTAQTIQSYNRAMDALLKKEELTEGRPVRVAERKAKIAGFENDAVQAALATEDSQLLDAAKFVEAYRANPTPESYEAARGAMVEANPRWEAILSQDPGKGVNEMEGVYSAIAKTQQVRGQMELAGIQRQSQLELEKLRQRGDVRIKQMELDASRRQFEQGLEFKRFSQLFEASSAMRLLKEKMKTKYTEMGRLVEEGTLDEAGKAQMYDQLRTLYMAEIQSEIYDNLYGGATGAGAGKIGGMLPNVIQDMQDQAVGTFVDRAVQEYSGQIGSAWFGPGGKTIATADELAEIPGGAAVENFVSQRIARAMADPTLSDADRANAANAAVDEALQFFVLGPGDLGWIEMPKNAAGQYLLTKDSIMQMIRSNEGEFAGIDNFEDAFAYVKAWMSQQGVDWDYGEYTF